MGDCALALVSITAPSSSGVQNGVARFGRYTIGGGGGGGGGGYRHTHLHDDDDGPVADAMKPEMHHTCSPEATAMIGSGYLSGGSGGEGSSGALEDPDDISDSVDELRAKLANMKRLMEERKGTTLGEISARKQRYQNCEMIDGNFLSWIFGTALAVILSVSFYAFYNLYNAVLKKFPSKHTEL